MERLFGKSAWRGLARSSLGCAPLGRAGDARNERGQSMAVFACALSALLVCLALAFDFGIVNYERTRTLDMVQQAEEQCLLPSTSLAVKNSDNPGNEMCHALVKYMRQLGYDGEIDAYYYEAPSGSYGSNATQRVYVFGMTVNAETRALFGRMFEGLGNDDYVHPIIPTRVRSWSHAVAYSSTGAWRPVGAANGAILHVEAGSDGAATAPTYVSVATEDAMPGVTGELAQAEIDAA